MAHRILEKPEDLDAFTALLGNLKLPVTVEWVQGRDRSTSQNKLMWLWATEVSEQTSQETAAEVQRRWKLEHGVPILREDNPRFRATYDKLIKDNLTYEQKLEAMEFIEVTSIFKVRQMVRFLDAVSQECAEQGIKLTDPDPDLASYQSRYRSTETRRAA